MKIASGSDSVDCFDASLVRRLTQLVILTSFKGLCNNYQDGGLKN